MRMSIGQEPTHTKQVTRPITPQDWKDIERKLVFFYDRVVLLCDEYEVSLQLQRRSAFKNEIAFYVNGVVEGKWYVEDCEERRRFFCPYKKRLFSKTQIADMRKASKRIAKEWETKNVYITYKASWTSFRAFKSHLVKNNKVIQLICEDEPAEEETD